jgi:hypothetical protein
VAPVIDPPPTVTANVTGTPAIGNPLRSFTITDGSFAAATCAPGGAITVVKEFAAIVPAPWTGPDASPPQEICNVNALIENSWKTTDRNSFIVLKVRDRASERPEQGEGQKDIDACFQSTLAGRTK